VRDNGRKDAAQSAARIRRAGRSSRGTPEAAIFAVSPATRPAFWRSRWPRRYRSPNGNCAVWSTCPDTTLAIVIESSLDEAPLAAQQRDLLWKALGLPVFEQLRGWDGTIIARECEVHDGLHFDAGALIASVDGNNLLVTGRPTGLSAEIVQEPCECGVKTPRFRHVGVTAAPPDDAIATPPNVQLKFCVGWMLGIAALLIGGEVLRRAE
jgi:hypothetical protein